MPGVARRADVPVAVAARRLDLDDVGAEVAEHLARQGPEHHAAEFEHAHARRVDQPYSAVS